MVNFSDVRLTRKEIARDAGLKPDDVKAMLSAYEPLGTNDAGEALYSIRQMMGALFRGLPEMGPKKKRI